MRQIITLLILICILSCSTNSKKIIEKTNSRNFKWATYLDTINAGFIMTFKYPDNLVIESIENGRCIGELIKTTDSTIESDITNKMRWCIWMNDTNESTPIDSLISEQRYFFKGQIKEQRENIIINNEKAIRVTFKSNNQNDPYRQMIYFKKYSTIFEIINNYGQGKDFEIFYNSLTINETKKLSR